MLRNILGLFVIIKLQTLMCTKIKIIVKADIVTKVDTNIYYYIKNFSNFSINKSNHVFLYLGIEEINFYTFCHMVFWNIYNKYKLEISDLMK